MARAVVLDAAGFFSGYASMLSGDEIYTVGEVIEEIKDPLSRAAYENLSSARKIKVAEPSANSVRKIAEAAAEEDLLEALSTADKKLIALALDLKKKGYDVVLITDDSYIHRLAVKLGIESRGARRNTPRAFRPRLYICRVCGYRSKRRAEKCPQCGSKLSVL